MNTIEEIMAILTEGIFHHRWVLLETYHQVGKTMVENQISIKSVPFQRKKDLHYAIELYKKYPDLNSVPDGKNVSWYKITKTLPPYEKDSTKKKVEG